MTDTDKQLPQGALYLSLGQGVFVLSGYILHAFLARRLMPSLYGTFGVAMVVLGWAEITVNNGIAPALQKFLPDESLSARSVRRAAVLCQAIISGSVFLTLFAIAPWLAALLRDPTLTDYLRVAFLDIPAMGAYAYYRGVLNGWRAFRQLALTIAAYSLTKLLSIVVLVYLGLGVKGALIGNVVSSFGGLAVGFLWVRRKDIHAAKALVQLGTDVPPFWGSMAQLPKCLADGVPKLPVDLCRQALAGDTGAPGEASALPADREGQTIGARQMMAFALPTVLFTLASNVLLGLDLMGVKALLTNAEQVGYYSAAVNLANAPRLVLLAFSFALLPSLSHAIAAHDQPRTRRYLQQAFRLLALALLPILGLVTATAGPLITFVFSAAYQQAAPILIVLIFTYAAYTIYITLVTALLAENRPGRALIIPVALLPVATGFIWLGVTRLGALGAAFASLLSVAIAAAVVIGYVLRRFRPAVDGRSLGRILLASAAIWGLARLWAPTGLALILGYGVLGGLYLALLLVLGEIKPQDVALVRSWLSYVRRGKGVRRGTGE